MKNIKVLIMIVMTFAMVSCASATPTTLNTDDVSPSILRAGIEENNESEEDKEILEDKISDEEDAVEKEVAKKVWNTDTLYDARGFDERSDVLYGTKLVDGIDKIACTGFVKNISDTEINGFTIKVTFTMDDIEVYTHEIVYDEPLAPNELYGNIHDYMDLPTSTFDNYTLDISIR